MEYQSMPILSVKFKIPEPRRNYITRKILFDRLKEIEKKKVTIVKAGAGSGKTTLLSSFIKEQHVPNIKWITLDNHMNQVFIFWKYVLEGTKDFFGETVGNFQNWFDGNIQKDNLWQILSMFMNKLYQENDIVLVLDDFQIISDEFLLSTIEFFIANMPDNLHLVLLTRVLPAINLGTLTMEDNLLLIDEPEIRMSEEESRDFLIHTLDIKIDEDRINTMVYNSNGWVGGLQLMAVAAKEHNQTMIPSLFTTDRVIGDYITNEIYRYLTENEREFLKKTAILSYYNQTICEHYLPDFNFNEIMGSILKKNLLVISIDEQEKVYRYHSIMKDYLVSLIDQDMEEKELLHNRAADIFYQMGDYDESLLHLFAIKAYEKIMKILMRMPQTSLTFSYMMKVPVEEISKNTDFAYQYFFCHYASMEIDACERIYHYIINNMKDDETFSAFKHADLFFDVNWEFENINIISLEKIDAMPLNLVTKAYLFIKEAYFLFLSDKYKEAFLYLDKAQEIYKKTGNTYIELFILAEKTQMLEEKGELKEALFLYKKMEKTLKQIPTMKVSYYIGIAGVYIRKMALSKAKEALDLAQESMIGNVANVKSAYLYTLAEYLYITGEHEKTIKIITDLGNEELYQGIFFSARLLRYPIYRGNHNELATKFVNNYEAADNIIVRSLDTELLYAGILYENGKHNKAMELVDGLIAKARKIQNKLKIVEGALLKTRFIVEQKVSAREVINIFIEAVFYAYENTLAIPFWFEKKTVIFVLNQYHEELVRKLSKEELEFVQSIVYADQEKGLEVPVDKGFDLTERELEVLEELKKGCANKQIAENLCISLATVKSHIINIYGKLGVNNRVAAINKIK